MIDRRRPLIWGNISPCCLPAAISPAASIWTWGADQCGGAGHWHTGQQPITFLAPNFAQLDREKADNVNLTLFLPWVFIESNSGNFIGSVWESMSFKLLWETKTKSTHSIFETQPCLLSRPVSVYFNSLFWLSSSWVSFLCSEQLVDGGVDGDHELLVFVR